MGHCFPTSSVAPVVVVLGSSLLGRRCCPPEPCSAVVTSDRSIVPGGWYTLKLDKDPVNSRLILGITFLKWFIAGRNVEARSDVRSSLAIGCSCRNGDARF